MRRSGLLVVLALSFGVALSVSTDAQSAKPVPGFADYGKWESIALSGSVTGVGGGGGRFGGGGAGLSADGKWLGHTITKSNRDSELRLLNLTTNAVEAEPFGSGLSYTRDSKWAGWSIGYSTAQQDRMRAQNTPVQNKLAIFNLTSGQKTIVDGVSQFSFSPDGHFIEMRRYAPASAPGAGAAGSPAGRPGGGGGRGGGGAGGGDNAPVGITVIVRNLATGSDVTFGNVGESAWQDGGATLAMTISAAEKAGNGVQLYTAGTGTLRVLDSSPNAYSGLTWRSDASDLAVLRAKTDDTKDGPTYEAIAWTGVGSAAEKKVAYDPTADTTFPAGMRLVSFQRPSWSNDGKNIELGFAEWDDKIVAQRGGGAGATADGPADVVVWHWKDPRVMSAQKLSAARDERRNLPAIWHLSSNTLTPIGKSFDESVAIVDEANIALVSEWSKYAMARSIGRPATDVTIADLNTGVRTPLKSNIAGNVQLSTNGKYALFVDGGNYWTINLATKAVANVTKGVSGVFVDTASDSTGPSKPMFGIGGWTTGDAALIVYDQYDIWQVSPDGSGGTRLTDGRAEKVRHRLVTVEPGSNTDGINLAKPQFVALFGEWSKKSGYGRLKPGGGVDRLIFTDKAVGGLGKAKDADVYVHTVQGYDDSPDVFVSDASLANAKQVTHTNAFQDDYAWGKSETIEYATDKIHNNGERLQATLYYPAGYQPGKQYPMIVYIYETLSDNVHQYVVPSDRSYYNTSVFTTQGYFVLQPDITFRPKEPGLSVVESVVPAVKAAVAKGAVDPKRVGVVGHSWGGFDTAFLATHTNGVFAAAIGGAAITDLVSNYGNGHWSSGIAETDHIETGQQRMVVPLYEDLQAYIRNSAVFNIANMTVPLLLEVGNQDGTVFWHQGVEMYNIARRAGKNVVMIEYNGEDHGLGQYKNQKDYQQRILQWFGHYLKGDTAPAWITDGQSYLERQDEIKKAGAGSGRGGRGGGH
jgi:dipeptidyl aminopeptidase/acylaminoacyl peptidase